jgi:anthraniloyl-CoA monooxygenase
MEDTIALDQAIGVTLDASALERGAARVPAGQMLTALQAYESSRRDEVGRIQHSANVSLVWFENVRRFWTMDPVQFNLSLLTRSKQITYENLRLRDPSLVREATRWWNRQEAGRLGIPVAGAGAGAARTADGTRKLQPAAIAEPAWLDAPPMFAPFRLREMTLANRVVVSPMAQYSAVDGVPNDWHLVHYGARAQGGAGLVFVEMTCVSPEGRITPGCTGLWNREQQAGFRRISDFVHQHTPARLCMQLGHAGRKGSTQLGWEQMDMPLADVHQNWSLIAPSPLPYREGVNQTPRAMTRADMDKVIADFARSARLAIGADFDMLEVHMAHGYLLASFLSPITNRRKDAYGGSLAARMRFPMEVFEAVRAVWPAERPISVRLSATDWIPGGLTGADSVEIARTLKTAGCDLIDVSTGQTDPASRPVYGRMYQAGFSEQIRHEAGLPTMAVGAVTTADQVNTLLISGRADLVALARPHLANPFFTLHAAAEQDFPGVSWPLQYHTGAQQMHSLARRAR